MSHRGETPEKNSSPESQVDPELIEELLNGDRDFYSYDDQATYEGLDQTPLAQIVHRDFPLDSTELFDEPRFTSANKINRAPTKIPDDADVIFLDDDDEYDTADKSGFLPTIKEEDDDKYGVKQESDARFNDNDLEVLGLLPRKDSIGLQPRKESIGSKTRDESIEPTPEDNDDLVLLAVFPRRFSSGDASPGQLRENSDAEVKDEASSCERVSMVGMGSTLGEKQLPRNEVDDSETIRDNSIQLDPADQAQPHSPNYIKSVTGNPMFNPLSTFHLPLESGLVKSGLGTDQRTKIQSKLHRKFQTENSTGNSAENPSKQKQKDNAESRGKQAYVCSEVDETDYAPKPEQQTEAAIHEISDEDWMMEIDEDEAKKEEDPAIKFAVEKRKYKDLKKAKQNRYIDDIEFTRLENKENARLKRLEIANREDLPRNKNPGNEENPLFVDDDPLDRKGKKRAREIEIESSESEFDLDDDENLRKSAPEAKKPRLSEPKKSASRKGKINKSILNECLNAGAEAEILKERKRTQTAKAGAVKNKVVDPFEKQPKSRKSNKRKGRKNGSDLPASTAANLFQSISSLTASNVYADANANLGRDGQPGFTAKQKSEALKQLIASVPLKSRAIANTDKNHVLDASKIFGHGKARSDGKGRWKIKGMASTLHHYQLLSTAFMFARETGSEAPYGGLLADEMGFGKTVMMIATMVTHQPAPNYANRTTLIVAPPGLIPQWLSEIGKHTENNSLGDILRYHAGTKPTGNNPVGFLEKADIVITTYNEVMSSYPKFKPPADALSHRQKLDWWKEEFEARRGPLHRMKFFRVILDEAQVIRNHKSQTSIGCRALMADHYWAISGTPILNRVEELYPYFKFLRVKHTGDIEVFKENFCEKDSGLSNQRLHSFLRRFMMRRTHKDSLFGAPIVSLPKAHEETIYITFNEVERTIYQMIHKRYFETFNGIRAKGTIRKEYKNILVMLLRLRQFTAHMFLCQETLQDLLTLEDIEKLWAFTVNETKPNNPNNLLLKQARKLIIAHTQGNGVPGSENSKEGSYIPNHPLGDEMAAAGPSVQSDSEEYNGKGFGLNYRFRKYLRNLRTGEKWDDLRDRSLCHRCQEIPDEPQVTSCMHVYCNECILVLSHEASRQGLDQTSCLECGEIYTSVEPCYGISELDGELRRESMDNRRSTTGQTPSRQDRKKKPDVLKWINMEGSLLPSAKTVALKAQILLWFKEKPDEKIIIYTQFRDMISIMSKICQLEGWESREYSGRMSYDCREKSLEAFATNKNIKILISSLKCGGVGLNLTMASRVLCVDLWWNSSVEQQAFCRIFRIGQERETYITRFVVRNSIDEKLLDMQKEKSRIIDAAIGDSNGGRSKEFTVDELLHLFGPVREEEDDGKEFIIVDDDVEEIEPPMAEGEPPILTNRDSLSRRRGKGRAK